MNIANSDEGPSRRGTATTPSRRQAAPLPASEPATPGSASTYILERKRSHVIDKSENLPSKKHQSENDLVVRNLFGSKTDRRLAMNISHTKGFTATEPSQNELSFIVGQEKLNLKLSGSYDVEQTGEGNWDILLGSGRAVRVPLTEKDKNRG